MLEKIREGSQGVIAKSILVLVILSFAFAGVSSYLGSSGPAPAATVNGQDISRAQFEQAYQSERARLEQQLGEMFNTLAANDNYLASLKQSVLDRLIGQVLLQQAANKLGLRVSDEQIKQAIISETAFHTDGKFDNQKYLAILRQLGYQPEVFSEIMRKDLVTNQLVNGLVSSEFVMSDEVSQLAQLQEQTRDIQYKIIAAEPFTKKVTITDEQAKDFYQANQADFMSPEMISLAYVDLNVADLAKHIKVSDNDAQAYYTEHKASYSTPEKRLAAHILIAKTDDEAADKAKADKIYQQLKQGADFAKLAKQDSSDQFSAEKGGELDWFEKGVMQPSFDEALFEIPTKGDISPVVKTDFGYHIIKLLDIQPVRTANFADVKDKIISQLQEDKAKDEFYQLQQKLADVSYEVPDTLSDAAEAVNASVKQTGMFSRSNLPTQLNNPAIAKAAFSDQVLNGGMNSDVIELSPDHVVVIRVTKHQQAGVLPFADVKTAIVSRLTQQKANELAKASAEQFIADIKAGKKVEMQSQTALARTSKDVNRGIITKAFEMPAPKDKQPSFATVALPEGYALVELNKVNSAADISDKVLDNIKQGLLSQYTQADYLALIAELKSKADIEISDQQINDPGMLQ